MIIKLLKTAALFFMAMQKPPEVDARMAKETMDEIDNHYSGEVKNRLNYINSEIDRLSNGFRNAHELNADEWYYGLSEAESIYKHYYQSVQDQYRENQVNMLNTFKRLALGLDALFKATNQSHVKYHLVASAVYQSIYDLFEKEDMNALRAIFGDVVDDKHTLHVMRSMAIDIVDEAKATTSDGALNNVLNNWRTVDQKGRFQSYILNEPKVSSFRGKLVINHSYKSKDTFEPGDTVNVVMTIDHHDASELVHVVKPQLQALGLEVGRLTGTSDTDERHVSFALRVRYSEQLAEKIKHLNAQILPTLTFITAAQLRVVTPMDIRTSRSAISLLDAETVTVLQQLQQDVINVAGDTGNQLPQLHITHGNSPIKFISLTEIEKSRHFASTLNGYLRAYNLDLFSALNAIHTVKSPMSEYLYLVCHDYKHNDDEAIKSQWVKHSTFSKVIEAEIEVVWRLPRLGIVDIATGRYEEVSFDKTDPLQKANDLESLAAVRGNEYMTCESNGKCYHIALDTGANGHIAKTISTLQLPVPQDKWFHIEGLTIEPIDNTRYKVCYDHRGGIYAGQEPWSRCVTHDLMHQVDDFEETFPEDPFAIPDPVNTISDHALVRSTGHSYFVAAWNFKGINNNVAAQDKSYSFIYTNEQCLKYIEKERVQALHIDDDELIATIATDKDQPGAEKVCQFSLQNPEDPMICHTVPHGMGGIAPVRYGFFDQRLKTKPTQPQQVLTTYSTQSTLMQCR